MDISFAEKAYQRLSILYALIAWTAFGWMIFKFRPMVPDERPAVVEEEESESIKTAKSWVKSILEQDADWYYYRCKNPAEIVPGSIRKFKWSSNGFEEQPGFSEGVDAYVEKERQAALESNDPIIRKRWNLLPTPKLQEQFDKFEELTEEEKEQALIELKRANEKLDQVH